jgi:hypothetical protein
MVAFFPMRVLLLLAKNLFVAATERGLRKHFAHFQANGGRKISESPGPTLPALCETARGRNWVDKHRGAVCDVPPGRYWHPRRTIDGTDVAPPAV